MNSSDIEKRFDRIDKKLDTINDKFESLIVVKTKLGTLEKVVYGIGSLIVTATISIIVKIVVS